jgi:uncharacterized protein YndB with AHSA1/START domain
MTEIVVEQRIEAPPATVWRYLTESDHWAEWHGDSAELEARAGGIFSLHMENGMNARGQFTELIPFERIQFTWGWVDRPGIPPGSTIVDIALTEEAGGTRLTLTHRNLPADEAAAHRQGWERFLPRMAAAAEGA